MPLLADIFSAGNILTEKDLGHQKYLKDIGTLEQPIKKLADLNQSVKNDQPSDPLMQFLGYNR